MTIRSSLRTAVAALPLVAVLPLLACSSEQKEAKEPERWTVERDDSGEELEVMQEYGGMSQEKVDRVIKKIYGDLADCLMQGQRRVELLGGDVQFYVEVDLTGQAQLAFIERSTLGDYDTEQCMLGVLRAQKWPKPVGGYKGKVQSSIGFDPPEDVRPAQPWDSELADSAIEGLASTLDGCGGGGHYSITAYVDTSGSVLAAGVAHSEADGDNAGRCMVDAVKSAQFPSPGSYPAKLTFTH